MEFDYIDLISLAFSKILLYQCSHGFNLCEAILSPTEPFMINFSLVSAFLIRYFSLTDGTAATAFTIAYKLEAFSEVLFACWEILIDHAHTS